MQLRKVILTSIFLVVSAAALGQTHTVWQIGEHDSSAGEFALNDDYRSFGKRFPDGIAMFEVGRSKSADMPYVLPGSSDAWAGNTPGHILIRFGLQSSEEDTGATLRLNLVESHPSAPPTLEITVNGFTVKAAVPAGNNQEFLDNHRTTTSNLAVEVEIPAGILKAGANTLSIKNANGSWIVLDNIMLAASRKMSLAKVSSAQSVDMMDAEAIPALIGDDKTGYLQVIKIGAVNWSAKPQTVTLSSDGKQAGSFRLQPGLNHIEFGLPEVETERTVVLEMKQGNYVAGNTVLNLAPVKKWTVYLIQHTHTDIGYTRAQTEILKEHLRYIDYAIEYCELTENYPDDAKFRWTCETSWAVNEYLKNWPAEKIQKLKKYIESGQIEVTAMFFNMSEIVDEHSLKTFLAPVAAYRKNELPV